jgi:hypothetical protein
VIKLLNVMIFCYFNRDIIYSDKIAVTCDTCNKYVLIYNSSYF